MAEQKRRKGIFYDPKIVEVAATMWIDGSSLREIGKAIGSTAKCVNNFMTYERSRGSDKFPPRWKQRSRKYHEIVALLDELVEFYPKDGKIEAVRRYVQMDPRGNRRRKTAAT